MSITKSGKYFLGLNITGPNTSACLLSDEEIIAFVEEERFTRVKLASDKFPINSVKYVLSAGGIELKQVSEIGIGWDYSRYPEEMRKFYAENMRHHGKDKFSNIVEELNLLQKSPTYILQIIKVLLWRNGLGSEIPKIKFYPHHESHAASAAYLAPQAQTLNFVIDGSGEDLATSVWICENEQLNMVSSTKLPNSIGYFYAAITEFLGFSVFTGEGKVMGMAPYGAENLKYREKLSQFLSMLSGSYLVDPSYVYFGSRSSSLRHTDELGALLNRRPRVPESTLEQDDYDLAFEAQKLLELVVTRLFHQSFQEYNIGDFTISGGVAMNCKMNGELSRLPFCNSLFVPPASNDAGVALGSALLNAKDHGLDVRKIGSTFSPYLGPSFSNSEILAALRDAKIRSFFELNDQELVEAAAKELKEGKILGWFQGRMEVGSRALGNRSILANPTINDMKNQINREVKRRESFRPFAPAIISESAHDWIDFSGQSNPELTHKWMLQAAYVHPGIEQKIPAVTHIDLSVRPQLVSSDDNYMFWSLLKEFEKLTGIPILLNTSLNVRGEPIIRTPEEALRCFFSHGLDALFIGNYVLLKYDR